MNRLRAPLSISLCTATLAMLACSGWACSNPVSESATVAAGSERYEITLEANGEKIATVKLVIGDESAVATTDDVTERFDLKKRAWFHDDLKVWVPLSECETWAEQSKAMSRKSADDAPETSRPFLQWSLDPQFEITATNDLLMMKSGQVDYEIAVRPATRDSADFYLYSRLNAYKKAMAQKKLPPFAELRVLEELERRKLIPESMTIAIPGVPGSPTFRTSIAVESERTSATN